MQERGEAERRATTIPAAGFHEGRRSGVAQTAPSRGRPNHTAKFPAKNKKFEIDLLILANVTWMKVH